MSSKEKYAGVAAPARVQSAVQPTKKESVMNNVIVDPKQRAVIRAFDRDDIAYLNSVHHSTVKAALKSDWQRALLFEKYARSEFEPPRWTEKYAEKYQEAVSKTVNALPEPRQPRHHVSLGRRVIQSSVEAKDYVPLILGDVSFDAWGKEIKARQDVITKSEREVSAAANTLWRSQFAMTKIAMALKAAVDLKGMNTIEATRVANAVHDKLQDVTAAYAAERGINHREIVMAEVTIATKHGCFDTSDSDERYWEEQLIEAGLGWDEIAEVEHERELEKQSAQNELINRKDATAEDEGRLSTALHEFRQLAELDAKDIEYAEGSYAQVAFMDMNWPTDDPMWPEFTDRLDRAWTASIEWAEEGPAKQELIAKTERRDEVVKDFHCRPYMTRWVLNHLTRRAWRDIHFLGIKRKGFAERIDRIVQDKYLNERYRIPVGQNRQREEGVDNNRVINLLYREVSEGEIKADTMYTYATEHTFDGLNGASVTAQKHIDVYADEGESEAGNTELRFWGACIDEIDDIIPGLKRLYGKLRAMEKDTAPLWEMFAKNGRPSEPPIYWNRALSDEQLRANPGSRNYYLTEEEAVAALHREIKEQGVKMRKEDGNALERAMALLGHNHGIDV